MDPATASLIGVAIGAISGVTGSIVSAYMQQRRERLTFRRERKAEAYANAVEHLFRAAARRSELTAEGKPILSEEDQGQWFLDLADGLRSLTTVIAYASQGFRPELIEVLQHYGTAVWQLTQEGLDIKLKPLEKYPYIGLNAFVDKGRWEDDIPNILWKAAATVQQIAMWDLAGYDSEDHVLREHKKP